jgi:transcriptional regulator with XRE-family HTH domain
MLPKRPVPNVDDPLAESTPQRRLWAAYLRRGYTRAQFARAIECTYNTLDAWDTEQRVPDLAKFARAAALVGYTVDELLHGHNGPRGAQAALDDSAVRALLDRLRASDEACTALAEHRTSPRGLYARFTAGGVTAFVRTYSERRARGATHEQARDSAVAEMAAHVAAVDARAAGVRAVGPAKQASVRERVRERLAASGVSVPEIEAGPAVTRPRRVTPAKPLRQRGH